MHLEHSEIQIQGGGANYRLSWGLVMGFLYDVPKVLWS